MTSSTDVLSPLHRAEGLFWTPLGGLNDNTIGGNCNLVSYKGKNARGRFDATHVMIDLGGLMTSRERSGQDELIPDATECFKHPRAPRTDPATPVAAILLTHGHLDHISGLIHYIRQGYTMPPIHGTQTTVNTLLEELGRQGVPASIVDKLPIEILKPGEKLRIGPMEVTPIAVSHSYAGSVGFHIETPQGRLFMSGDAKWDQTIPLQGRTDVEGLKRIAGVDAMFMDSTSIHRDAETPPEADVKASLGAIFREHKDKRITALVMANNHQRLATLCQLAAETGRAVMPVGWSIRNAIKALELSRVDLRAMTGAQFVGVGTQRAQRLRPHETLILATGTQGEPDTNLYRAARGAHTELDFDPRFDTLVNSSTVIPGNEKQLQDALKVLQARMRERFGRPLTVVDASNAFVHVSGHPGKGDVQNFYDAVKPKVLVPYHGSSGHLEHHAAFAGGQGIPAVLVRGNCATLQIGPKGVFPVAYRHDAWIGMRNEGSLKEPKWKFTRNLGSDGLPLPKNAELPAPPVGATGKPLFRIASNRVFAVPRP